MRLTWGRMERKAEAPEVGASTLHRERRARLKVVLAVLSATLFIFPFKIAASQGHGKGAAFGLLLGVCVWLGIPAGVRYARSDKEKKTRTLRLGWRLAIAAALGNIAQGFAFAELHAGIATVLLQTNFLFVAAFGSLWLREKLSGVLILGLGLTMVGVAATRWSDLTTANAAFGWGVGWGVLWALGTAICFSMMDLVSRRHGSGTDSLVANAHRSFAAAVLIALVPGTLCQFVSMEPSRWGACLLAAALGPGLARNLLMSAAKELRAVESALLQQLRPLLALPLASAYFGNWPSLSEWIGSALILLGVVLPVRFK